MFSILLAVYKKENPVYFSQSLDSIFSQILFPHEVVLVKDGPLTDDLERVINKYQSKYYILKVVSLPVNQGLGKALNEGLKHCSHDLVARMDTDDIVKPDRFEKQLKIFQEDPEVDVVGSWIDEFEGDISHVVSVKRLPECHEEILSFAKKRNPINHPVVMFRKKAVLAAGGYQHFPLFEDYYLWVRMLMNGAKFYNIQESLLYFRSSPDMFKRRGGLKYVGTEVRFQNFLLRSHFISFPRYVQNVIIRVITRIMPNRWRALYIKKAKIANMFLLHPRSRHKDISFILNQSKQYGTTD